MVTDLSYHDDETLGRVYKTMIDSGLDPATVPDTIGALLNAGILFREVLRETGAWAEPVIRAEIPVPAAVTEPDWAERQRIFAESIERGIAEGKARRAEDREPEFAKSEMATQAEEPIEHRLRRAWLNGYGEGFNRGSWGDNRWDR